MPPRKKKNERDLYTKVENGKKWEWVQPSWRCVSKEKLDKNGNPRPKKKKKQK
jgi:hypothetical protein